MIDEKRSDAAALLDNIDHIDQLDQSHMLDTICEFPNQIQEALNLFEARRLEAFYKIDNIIVTGMGASGLTGDIIQALFRDKVDIPIYVNKDYDLPKWAKKDTLTIFLSYSGNTEETISSFKQAYQKKCKILCVSSGGKLEELCVNRKVPHFLIPKGFQPREAIAYLLYPTIAFLKKTGVIKTVIEHDISESIELVKMVVDKNKKTVPVKQNPAKKLALQLYGSVPQIYGWNIYAPIANRWRTQFNENSKLVAHENVVPECNHNDIVGWSSNPEITKLFSCLLFRDKIEESLYLSTRLNFMKTLFTDTVKETVEIHACGKTRLGKMIYLLCLGDFVSCYLAISRGMDPSVIDAITELKNQLEAL